MRSNHLRRHAMPEDTRKPSSHSRCSCPNRYELEKGLVEGSVSVEELPALWSARMKEYLGSEPKSDAQGVLQDVHWSAG